MMRSPEECRNWKRQYEEENATPYVDSMTLKDIMKLAVWLAESEKIRGASKGIMEVGLFTLVKKVDEDEKIVLKLVLDQRVPHE